MPEALNTELVALSGRFLQAILSQDSPAQKSPERRRRVAVVGGAADGNQAMARSLNVIICMTPWRSTIPPGVGISASLIHGMGTK